MTISMTTQTHLRRALLCAALAPIACIKDKATPPSTTQDTATSSGTTQDTATSSDTTQDTVNASETTTSEGSSSSGSSGTSTSGSTGADTSEPPPDAYGACSNPGCFTQECEFNGSLDSCCILNRFTCSPICDGDLSLCPLVPGFEVGCNPVEASAGHWSGHCFIKCNEGDVCPGGMMCKNLGFGPFCTFK